MVKDDMLPAMYKCFDCGATEEGEARDASYVGTCKSCQVGMMLVYTLNNKPKNRGYFPDPKTR